MFDAEWSLGQISDRIQQLVGRIGHLASGLQPETGGPTMNQRFLHRLSIHGLYGSIHPVGAMAGKARQLPLSSGVTPGASAKHVRASVLA